MLAQVQLPEDNVGKEVDKCNTEKARASFERVELKKRGIND
jgi:hypothetical protein